MSEWVCLFSLLFLPTSLQRRRSGRSVVTHSTGDGGPTSQLSPRRPPPPPLFLLPFFVFLLPLTQFTSIISWINFSATQHVDDEVAGQTLHCLSHWNEFLFTTNVSQGAPLSSVPLIKIRKVLLNTHFTDSRVRRGVHTHSGAGSITRADRVRAELAHRPAAPFPLFAFTCSVTGGCHNHFLFAAPVLSLLSSFHFRGAAMTARCDWSWSSGELRDILSVTRSFRGIHLHWMGT